MDKKRTQIIITGVLVVVMILVWANSIKILVKRSKSKKAYQTSPQVIFTPNNALSVPVEEPLVAKRTFPEEKSLDWKRCPFSGRNYSKEGITTDLTISGIIWGETNPQTIINGRILSEGESIGDFIVEKIEKQKVTLSNGTRTIELRI